MLTRYRISAVLLGFALFSLVAAPVIADDAERIDKLIEQLGSSSFQDREAATKALDAIGSPALEKLRQATQGDDAEIKRRANDLVRRIEKRVELSRVLTAKRVHLVYKDTPLKEALEDFKKKSGYDFVLHDPENKLADRKVTLDTGKITFWEAFDKFCDAAGLVQTSQQEMAMEEMQEQMRPLLKQLPPPPPPAPPVKKPEAKEAPPRPAPAEDEKPGATPKPEGAAKADERREAEQAKAAEVQAKLAAEQAARALALVREKAVLQAQLVARRERMMGVGFAGMSAVSSEQILLKDGKRKRPPTHYAGTVRIRAVEAPPLPGVEGAPLIVNLQVSTEPKFQLLRVLDARIAKAADDNGQSLSQVIPGEDADAPPVVGVFAPAGALVRRGAGIKLMAYSMAGPGFATIPLKKGEKPSKTLTELSGTLTLEMLDAPQDLITVDNVLKAGGTTTKDKAVEIKIVDVAKNENGQVKLRVQMQVGVDVVPANGQGVRTGFATAPMIRFNAIKAVPPPPVVPPPAEKPKEAPAKEEKAPAKKEDKQDSSPPKEVKPAAKDQVKEKGAVAPPPPVRAAVRAIAAPPVRIGEVAVRYPGNSFNGLTLVDDKGKSWQIVNVNESTRVGPAGVVETTYELTFEAKDKQGEPAKLIFSGSKTVSVDVPFTLKNISVQSPGKGVADDNDW